MNIPSLQRSKPTNTSHPPTLDETDISILHSLSAFTLPPKYIQDSLISLFFKWIAPLLPVINQTAFMTQYHNQNQDEIQDNGPPSILLLQAIFSATARTSEDTGISGSAKMYFRRAKALYDVGYERDPVTIVQALVLMSWYYDGPQDGTESGLFYWNKLGIVIAQDHNMHRSAEMEHLALPTKRLWKRIWWTLLIRDRAVCAAYGRPLSIFPSQTNVEMITEEDFLEEGAHEVPDRIHVQFFLQCVKLCKVLELVAFRPLTKRKPGVIVAEVENREEELNRWLLDLPRELEWRQSGHEFWAAVLCYMYNTIVCQFYGTLPMDHGSDSKDSQMVVAQAASTIVSVIESIVVHDQLQFAPPSIVYSITMVLITLKSQLSSNIPTRVLQTQQKVRICLELLGLVSKRWPIAQMIREASEIVFSEKRFTELLDAAMDHTRGEGQAQDPKPVYKRGLLNEKQARPELMLPKARNIVRMVLTTRSERKACVRNQGLTRPADVPVTSTRTTGGYGEDLNPNMKVVSEERFDLIGESHSEMREMAEEVKDFDLERPMIPLFGISCWGPDCR